MQQNHSSKIVFSKREQDIFDLLMQGFSNKQIASHLNICEKTVEKYLTSIYAQIGVKSRGEAILWELHKNRDFPT